MRHRSETPLMPYIHPVKENWSGRHDTSDDKESISDVIKLIHDPYHFTSEDAPAFAFIGFACNEAARLNHENIGAKQGPSALRKALALLPIPQNKMTLYDCGDIICEGENLDGAQAELALLVESLLRKNIHPIVLGGSHEITWGHYQGLYAANPGQEILIVNFDPHFDLHPLFDNDKKNSRTSFLQIAEHNAKHDLPLNYCCYGIQESGNTLSHFEQAKALCVNYVLASEFHEGTSEIALDHLDDVLHKSTKIYITISMDVFASAFAPGVDLRQPLGLFPWHVIPLLRRLAASGKVISLDVAGLCPTKDQDGVTAQLGALLIYHFLRSV
jgi:formiminoglutamase